MKTIKIPRLLSQITELIKSRRPTSIGEAVATTGANRDTVEVHLRIWVMNVPFSWNMDDE